MSKKNEPTLAEIEQWAKDAQLSADPAAIQLVVKQALAWRAERDVKLCESVIRDVRASIRHRNKTFPFEKHSGPIHAVEGAKLCIKAIQSGKHVNFKIRQQEMTAMIIRKMRRRGLLP